MNGCACSDGNVQQCRVRGDVQVHPSLALPNTAGKMLPQAAPPKNARMTQVLPVQVRSLYTGRQAYGAVRVDLAIGRGDSELQVRAAVPRPLQHVRLRYRPQPQP